jgi:hypothetical protein
VTADALAHRIDDAFVPRIPDTVAWAEVDEEIVAYEATTQRVHVLGGTAAIVWGGMDGRTSLHDLIEELTEAFGADPDVVRSDVLELARDLARKRLVEGPGTIVGRREPEREDPHAVPDDRSPTFLIEPPGG